MNTELFNLIERSIGILKLTDGAFDITYASFYRIWKFDGSMTKMPSEKAIKSSVAKVELLLFYQSSMVPLLRQAIMKNLLS